MSSVKVMKRNGIAEPFDIDKIHKVVSWAVEGLNNVNISDIEINAKINIADGITTSEIHSVLIESAANLISADNPEYQYVAGRLLNYQLRKAVWGGKNPPKLIDLIKKNIEIGRYTPDILNWYSKDELNKLDEYIQHDRDLTYTYASVKQLCDKYLVKNRKTGQLYETPQFRYMVASLTLFRQYPKNKRLQYVKRAYKYFSQFKINLATPQLASLGTTLNSYSSCLLIEMLDEMDSILGTQYSIAKAVSAGYGIGINFGRMRAINSPIRNGQVIHPGVVPFLKTIEANTKAWQKNGIRGGSATVNFPIWHAEIEDILQLKNANSGTHENRVVSLDYCVGLSKLFYQRFLQNQDITLFSPNDVPGLYDAFGGDEFDELYRKYEQDETVPKKVIKARDLFSLLVKERLETGRIYIINIDNVNKHGAWTKPVYMTNLCVEITQAIEPLKSLNSPESEIGICVLSAINWLAINSEAEFEKVCDITVRMLDEIIDIQDYFDVAAKNFCQRKRSLGIGVTNLAAFLAKNGVRYSDGSANELVDEWMEKQQYYLIKSSIELAKEKGRCEAFHTSKYSTGWLPIDKELEFKPKMDWESLRDELKQHGMRHCTLTAEMPCESSSVVQNATNGFEPVRKLLVYKSSKKSSIPFVVPYSKGNHNYELAFTMPSNEGYLKLATTMGKWIDMAMSVNQYFNPSNYPSHKIPYTQILKELIQFWKDGGKCLYYLNTDDENTHFAEENNNCSDGACTL